MGAVFKAEDTAVIKGRGVVLFGTVQEGVVKAGMSFNLPGVEKRLIINSVEFVNYEGPDRGLLGLLSDGIPEADFDRWVNLDVAGIEVTVNDEDV